MGWAKGAVEIADRRGNDGHLRVSWHPEKRVVNVSQWRGSICVASTPVELADVPAVVGLLVGALEEATRNPEHAGRTASVPPLPLRRLARRVRRLLRTPHSAQVIEMKRGSKSPDT